MTLREEINKIMAEYTFKLCKNKTIDVTVSEKILTLIEKWLGELSPATSSQHYLGCNDREQRLAYIVGWENALETAFKDLEK